MFVIGTEIIKNYSTWRPTNVLELSGNEIIIVKLKLLLGLDQIEIALFNISYFSFI